MARPRLTNSCKWCGKPVYIGEGHMVIAIGVIFAHHKGRCAEMLRMSLHRGIMIQRANPKIILRRKSK